MTWLQSVPVVPLCAGMAALYWGAVRRHNAAHPRRPVPPSRVAAFVTGVAVIGAALAGPFDRYAGMFFSFHMVQHLLLTLVAAPLVLLGAPVLVVRSAGPPALRRVLTRAVRGPVIRAAQFPLAAWGLFAAVLWGSHYSGLFEAALEFPAVHVLEHLLYLGAALLFWFPVVGAEPSHWRLSHPARLLYLFAAAPLNAFLALSLYQSARVLYPHYEILARLAGRSALADQQAGGAVMWIFGGLVMLVSIIGVAASWARHDAETARRLDARYDAEIARALDSGPR
jgi:putative copper resistance protein D